MHFHFVYVHGIEFALNLIRNGCIPKFRINI